MRCHDYYQSARFARDRRISSAVVIIVGLILIAAAVWALVTGG